MNENLTDVIAKKETELKKDVVRQEGIQEKMQTIQKKVAASPLDQEHKDRIQQELGKLHDAHKNKILSLEKTTETSLKSAVENIQKDLQTFESRPEVAFLFQVINAPEFHEIQKQQQSVPALEKKVADAAREYRSYLMANGELAPGHETKIEEYVSAINELYVGMNTLVQNKETFTASDANRLQILEKVLGKKNVMTFVSFKANPAVHGGVEATTSELKIPANTAELKNLQQIAAQNLLQVRSALYRTTGNPKYEEAYKQQCEMVQKGLTGQGSAPLEAVPTTLDNEAMKLHAQEKITSIGGEFAAIQNLRGKDPINAQRDAVTLLERLRGFTKGYKMGDADQDFQMVELKKFPEVEKAFQDGVNTYIRETENLILDATVNNPIMKGYQTDAMGVTEGTLPFIKSVETLFKQVQDGQGIPSENTMKMFHDNANGILLDPLFNKLSSTDAYQFFGNLKIPDEAASPRLHEIMTKMQEAQQKVKDYMHTVNVITRQVVAMQGHGVGLEAFFKDAAKFTAITVAAVAGAVAMGALVAASGGALTGVALFAANTAATSLGAAIGANYMTAAIEGNANAITTENMAHAWARGVMFSGAAGIGGQVLGTALGKSAQQMSQTFSIAPGKILTAPSIREGIKASGLKRYLEQVALETREEMAEDAMQKIGEGLAPTDPWLGFVFSLIPSASRKARNVLHSPGIESTVTNKGIEITYTNQAEAIQALEKAHAPAAFIDAIRLNHRTVLEEDGVSVTVGPADSVHAEANSETTIAPEATLDPDLAKAIEMREGMMKKNDENFRTYQQSIDQQIRENIQENIDPARNRADMQKVMEHIRESSEDPRSTIEDIYHDSIENAHLTPEQKSMALATAHHMMEVGFKTGVIGVSVHVESLRQLGVKTGIRPTEEIPKEAFEKKKGEILGERLAKNMKLQPFEGKIDYSIVSGVLVIKSSSNQDFINMMGGHVSHTTKGVALTAEESGMGVGIIFVRGDQVLNDRNSVIRHELQHIFKQGSNDMEKERAEWNRYQAEVNAGGKSYIDQDGKINTAEIQQWFEKEKGDALISLKDEALAFLHTTHMQSEQILATLLKERGAYDYLHSTSMWQHRIQVMTKGRPELQTQEFLNEIFRVREQARLEYRREAKQILDDVFDAVNELRTRENIGQIEARERISNQLIFVPIGEWSRHLREIMGRSEPSQIDQIAPLSTPENHIQGNLNAFEAYKTLTGQPRYHALRKDIIESFQEIDQGILPATPIGEAIMRLRVNDAEAYKDLRESDFDRLFQTECLEAIIYGKKETIQDNNGKKVTVYVGRDIAKGGMGTVAHVLYRAEGEKTPSFAVIKRSLPGQEQYFLEEMKAAETISSWNHEHIIAPLHATPDRIIYETSSDAENLVTALRKNNPIDQYANSLIEVGRGLQEYHKQQMFHGDLKEANALTLEGKTKIIDNSPISYDQVLRGEWAATPGYTLEPMELVMTENDLRAKGHDRAYINAHIGRAVDLKSYGVMIRQMFDHYMPDWEKSKSNKELLNLVEDLNYPLKAGEPGMLEKTMETLRVLSLKLSPAVVQVVEPAKPAIGATVPQKRTP